MAGKAKLLTPGSKHAGFLAGRLRPVLVFPLLVAAFASLAAGVWSGLLRVGIPVPGAQLLPPIVHGPAMIPGFLATLIGLERAVGSGRRWPYLAPIISSVGVILVLAGYPTPWGAAAHSLAALIFSATMLSLLWRHPAWYTFLFVLGGGCLLIGNLFWLFGVRLSTSSVWWLAFLIAIIAGERMELSRVARLPAWAPPTLVACFFFLLGVLCSGGASTLGGAVAFGAAIFATSVWLVSFDVAWRTIRHPGFPRFVALTLLSGFGWLAIGGLLFASSPLPPAGPRYDAALHAVFLGFVFLMIFAHAPMIFPAVLGLRVPFHQAFYVHVAVLHLSLVLRIAGDLMGNWFLRTWGTLGNATAVLLFLLSTGVQVARGLTAERRAWASKHLPTPYGERNGA